MEKKSPEAAGLLTRSLQSQFCICQVTEASQIFKLQILV